MELILLLSVCIVSICGLVYELIAATAASYLLGDSITHFSTIIGSYLFAMGIGSFLSKYIRGNILLAFVRIELLIAFFGGFSAALLYLLFPLTTNLYFPLYSLVIVIGIGVGAEIPLLMRILSEKMDFNNVVSNVLGFDYFGALLASVLFPLVFVPKLGLVGTSFFFGSMNAAIAILLLYKYLRNIPGFRFEMFCSLSLLTTLIFGFAYADKILDIAEAEVYGDSVLYSGSSPYQRIVVTRQNNNIKLHLNGQLQFNSKDEYRYHEALVHVGMSTLSKDARSRVLVLGGGDGLAIRELLKYQEVSSIVLVDLDSKVVDLFSGSETLKDLNKGSLLDKRVTLVKADALKWLRENENKFDFIVIDLPDPTSFSLGKLYTDHFYRLVKNSISEEGVFVVQATSPLIARKSFWMIANTIKSVGMKILPYHAYVPSFTDWGFILASRHDITAGEILLKDLKFIDSQILPSLFHFPTDISDIPVSETGIQTLSSQLLVSLYASEWNQT